MALTVELVFNSHERFVCASRDGVCGSSRLRERIACVYSSLFAIGDAGEHPQRFRCSQGSFCTACWRRGARCLEICIGVGIKCVYKGIPEMCQHFMNVRKASVTVDAMPAREGHSNNISKANVCHTAAACGWLASAGPGKLHIKRYNGCFQQARRNNER